MATIITRGGTLGKGTALSGDEYDENLKREVNPQAGAHTVTVADNRSTVEYTGSGGDSITLPDASTLVDPSTGLADTGDFQVTIKHGGTGVLTVAFNTGDTVDGVDNDLTLQTNECVTLKCGSVTDDWMIVNRTIPDGTEGYVMRMGAINPAWSSIRGFCAYKLTDVTTYFETFATITFGQEVYDTDAAHNASTGVVTIPSWATKVRWTVSVEIEANAAGRRIVTVSRVSGAVSPPTPYWVTSAISGGTTLVGGTSGWITVEGGATYKVEVFQDAGSGTQLDIIATNERTYFAAEFAA